MQKQKRKKSTAHRRTLKVIQANRQPLAPLAIVDAALEQVGHQRRAMTHYRRRLSECTRVMARIKFPRGKGAKAPKVTEVKQLIGSTQKELAGMAKDLRAAELQLFRVSGYHRHKQARVAERQEA